MSTPGDGFSVDMPVRVYPGTIEEKPGVVIDDYGETVGFGVDIADTHIAGPARRWAVRLNPSGMQA